MQEGFLHNPKGKDTGKRKEFFGMMHIEEMKEIYLNIFEEARLNKRLHLKMLLIFEINKHN